MRQLVSAPGQVGEILRARRKARGITQQELAAKLGISQSRLSTLEGDAGGLTLDRFILLAKLLGLEVVLDERAATTGNKKTEW